MYSSTWCQEKPDQNLGSSTCMPAMSNRAGACAGTAAAAAAPAAIWRSPLTIASVKNSPAR